MGPLIITILISLATLTTQKTVKLKDIHESPELETILQKLINEGQSSNYKDLNIKLNLNKKKAPEDETNFKYLGEISSEKEGKEGFKSLNKKLAKLLDGLQDNVMNENTKDPKCSCGYASKRWPGVIKCQCGSSSDDDDEYRPAEITKEKEEDIVDKDSSVKYLHNEKHQDRRKIRSVKDRYYEYRQMARFSKDDGRDDGYWSNDNRCGCKLLRSIDGGDELTFRCQCNSQRDLTRIGKDDNRDDGYWSDDNYCGCRMLRKLKNKEDDDDTTHYMRCRCNSPAREGKDEDKDAGYWSDDNNCGCQLLRTTEGDNGLTHYLKCGCNSPGRVGKNNDKVDGYWTDDTSCGCTLLRNTDDDNGLTHYLRCKCNNDEDDSSSSDDDSCDCQLLRNIGKYTKDLRCRCGSPSRAGRDIYSGPNKYGYTQRSDHYSAVLSDLSDSDNNYLNRKSKASSDENSLNTLMNFILNKDDNADLSHLPNMDRKVFIKLRDIMPSLRNVDINELKDKIESMLYENEYSLREQVNRQKADPENHLTAKQIQRLLKVIEQQKEPARYNKKMYRRSTPEDAMGVPFTYELQGLAQINT